MHVKKLLAKLSAGACLVGMLAAAQPAFAKTVCNIGAQRSSGNGTWGTASTCSCGSSIGGQINGQWNSGLWLYTYASSGTTGNEVWSQALLTAFSGGATQWAYMFVDNPGGGTSTEKWGGAPDWKVVSPYYVKSVCAN
jgi:hypothetical protein